MAKITEKQFLVLFDIAKGCLYSNDKQFAGYSKDEIMKLLNNIISQQDNSSYLNMDIEDVDFGEINENEKNDENFWD